MMRRWRLAALLLLAIPLAADESLNFGPPLTLQGNFLHPYGIAIDALHGRLLVADTEHHQLQWALISQAASGAASWTAAGYVSNRSDAAALTDPQALAVDAYGNVFVVNPLQGQVKLFRYTSGAYTYDPMFCQSTPTSVNGMTMLLPRDIAVGPDGSVYLLDSGNKRILKASGASATSWTVWHADPSWQNPYGIAIDSASAVYVADTDHHRIVKLDANGQLIKTFGVYGTKEGQFQYPRGVAIGPQNQIYVADTFNHRIQVFSSDFRSLVSLGQAPQAVALQKVAVDSTGKLFAIDSDAQDVLAFLGAKTKPLYDVFIRDYVTDMGSEPSDSHQTIASPDILIRHAPDVDLAMAQASGLDSFNFQEPQYGVNNYVYLAIHNRGTQAAPLTTAGLYSIDPADGGFYSKDWKSSGFYGAYDDGSHNSPGDTITIPSVAAGSVTVVGPLVWRAPKPESAGHGNGVFRLAVRLNAIGDNSPIGESVTMSRDSNNVSERLVTVTRPTTGLQNTLVLRANYSDISSDSNLTTIQSRCEAMAMWISSVSYSQTQLTFTYKGPVHLPHAKSHYTAAGQSVIIDLVQDALDKLLASDPNALENASGDITRLIIVTNDLGSKVDWATTGAWPYKSGGKTHYLTVSVQAGDNSTHLFSHGMSHQLGLIDLYTYSNVTADKTYIEGWDNMAQPINGAFPTVWSKELANWITSRDAKILWVPRPAYGSAWTNNGNPIHLTAQEHATAGQTVAVAIGFTNGVGTYHDEKNFYFLELRQKVSGDSAIPMEGVLVYRVNTDVPQGQGPLVLVDYKPSTKTLDDAAIPIGGHLSPTGSGLSIHTYPGTNGGDVDVKISYIPIQTDYDVYLHAGAGPGQSPDIWIDNASNGFDKDHHRDPKDRGDQGIAGEKNLLYAHFYNAGPAAAHDFELSYAISQPFHTVGGQPDFSEFHSVWIDELKSGEDTARYVTWIPETGINPHTCVQVTARRLLYDVETVDNSAQRNFEIDHSVHGSPYTANQFHFQVTNATDAPRTVYFRTDGIPDAWSSSLSTTQTYLQPGQSFAGVLQFTPNQATADCSQRTISVSGWTPQGDTLIQLGASHIQVDLQHKTQMTVQTQVASCSGPTATLSAVAPHCYTVTVKGQLTPAAAQPVTVRYANETAEPTYHNITSDTGGYFNDIIKLTTGNEWSIQATAEGTRCLGPVTVTKQVTIPLPIGTVVDPAIPPTDRAFCLGGLNTSVHWSIRTPSEALTAACPVVAGTSSLTLNVGTTTLRVAGLLSSAANVLQVNPLHIWKAPTGGLAFGKFDWTYKGVDYGGELIAETTGYRPSTIWLNGIVKTGVYAGSRMHALVHGMKVDDGWTGQLLGAVETECNLLPLRRTQRLNSLNDPEFCADGVSCLTPIAATGKGTTLLTESAVDHCPKCQSEKAWRTLSITMGKGGHFNASAFESAQSNGAAEHGSTFTWTTVDGKQIDGELVGIGVSDGIGEGLLRGTIVHGAESKKAMIGFYRLEFGKVDGRTQPVTFTLHGFVLNGCHQATPNPTSSMGTQSPPAEPSTPIVFKSPKLEPLPAPDYRPLSEIPKATVVAFTTKEGGHLTLDAIRRLQMADRTFRLALTKKETTLDAASFAKAAPLVADVSPKTILAQYDKNKDGFIDKTEAPSILKRYSYLDKNKDGKLSADELARIPTDVPPHDFAAADKNNDGRVTLTEFVLWVQIPSFAPNGN